MGPVRLPDNLAKETLYNKHKQTEADPGNNSESMHKETHKHTHGHAMCSHVGVRQKAQMSFAKAASQLSVSLLRQTKKQTLESRLAFLSDHSL